LIIKDYGFDNVIVDDDGNIDVDRVIIFVVADYLMILPLLCCWNGG
jgi:hypothetical protein